MINLETPKKFVPLVAQAHQVATEVFRPISRKYDLAEHEYPTELDMLAALIDGMNAGGDIGGAARRGVRREHSARPRRATATARTCRPCSAMIELCWGDVGLLLIDAAPGARQLRDRIGRQRGAARALRRARGRRWPSPSPRPARTPPRSAPPPCSTATSTCSTARRSTSPRASARTWSWCGRRSTAPRAAPRSSRSSWTARTPA